MDTLRVALTLIFMASIVISVLAAFYLYKKDQLHIPGSTVHLSRRKFLLAGITGLITLLIFERQTASSLEETVVCNGWVLKRKDLKPDACHSRAIY